MEDSKAFLQKLAAKFSNDTLKGVISDINEDVKKMDQEYSQFSEVSSDSLLQMDRKNKQMESEIERLQLLQGKNATGFSKKNNERIKLSRRIIELEQDNEDMESKLNVKEGKLSLLEEEIKALSHPSPDELYYEIIKGFGVEFIENEGRTYARVKNKHKNDLFLIDCQAEDLSKTCEKIWESMS